MGVELLFLKKHNLFYFNWFLSELIATFRVSTTFRLITFVHRSTFQ